MAHGDPETANDVVTATTGYSGTPLIKKLGYRSGLRVLFLGAPPSLLAELGLNAFATPGAEEALSADDASFDAIRVQALPLGLVDIKVCAVHAVWSCLKLAWRKEKRQSH